jgi:hypothetical protein
LHSNEPDSAELNASDANADVTVPEGPAVIEVSGAVPSTVHIQDAGEGSTTPAVRARALKVCDPSASPAYDTGVAQAAKGASSRLHSKVAPDLSEESVNDAVLAAVVAGGFEPIDVSGASGGGGAGSSASRIVRTTVP